MSALRHALAPVWLALHRIGGSFGPPPPGFRILLFHDVPDERLAAFEALVAYVVRHHGVLTPEQAAGWLAGGEPRPAAKPAVPAPCLFTFDDGFVSNFKLARTVLARHGVKAVFFVAPGLVDLGPDAQPAAVAANVFQGRLDAARLDPNMRLMSWDELAALKRDGHAIGCHGMSHRRLSELDARRKHAEIVDAGDIMDARLAQQTDWYAYAFGDIGSIDADALAIIAERYAFCRSGLRGPNGPGTAAMALSADSMAAEAPTAYQRLLLEGGLDLLYRNRRRQLQSLAAAAEGAP